MADETITRDELARALAVGVMEGEITLTAVSEVVAEGLFKIALHNREPEYEPGAIYRSPDGRTWFRMRRSSVHPGEGPGWRCCESGVLYNHSWPGQSLRKLVPEGHTAMLLATKLNAIRDLCSDDQGDPCWPHMVKSILAIIEGEGESSDGC